MNALREIAKFACGAEAFHSLLHAVVGVTGTTLTLFGFSATPTWNIIAAVINAIIALMLGFFAWGGLHMAAGSGHHPSLPTRSSK